MSIRQDRILRKQLKEAIIFFRGLQTDSVVTGSDLIKYELNLLELSLHRRLEELDADPKKPSAIKTIT